jgi:hypothetical protein
MVPSLLRSRIAWPKAPVGKSAPNALVRVRKP